jgi:DNA-directed RNA polymerase subunit beta
MDHKGLIVARIDRKKKIPATIILKALVFNTNEEIIKLFYTKRKLSF